MGITDEQWDKYKQKEMEMINKKLTPQGKPLETPTDAQLKEAVEYGKDKPHFMVAPRQFKPRPEVKINRPFEALKGLKLEK